MMFPLVTYIFVVVVIVAVFHPFAMVMSYPFHMLIFTNVGSGVTSFSIKIKKFDIFGAIRRKSGRFVFNKSSILFCTSTEFDHENCSTFESHTIQIACDLIFMQRINNIISWICSIQERERVEVENGDYGYVTFSASIILIELCRPVWVFESIEMQKYPQVFSEDRTSAFVQIIHRTTATKIHFTKWIAGCCLFDMNSLCVVFIVLLFCFGNANANKEKEQKPIMHQNHLRSNWIECKEFKPPI